MTPPRQVFLSQSDLKHLVKTAQRRYPLAAPSEEFSPSHHLVLEIANLPSRRLRSHDTILQRFGWAVRGAGSYDGGWIFVKSREDAAVLMDVLRDSDSINMVDSRVAVSHIERLNGTDTHTLVLGPRDGEVRGDVRAILRWTFRIVGHYTGRTGPAVADTAEARCFTLDPEQAAKVASAPRRPVFFGEMVDPSRSDPGLTPASSSPDPAGSTRG